MSEDTEAQIARLETELADIKQTLGSVHAMLTEVMPAARQAAQMLNKRQALLGMVTGRGRQHQ